MQIEKIKDPKLVARIIAAMDLSRSLQNDMKKEIPNETEAYSKIQSSQPEPIVRHEPLAEDKRETSRPQRSLVRITSFRAALLDPDNLCVKYLIDGLRYCRVITNDRAQDIELTVTQEKCKKSEERTEIEIDYSTS